jgi:hypothetical protein
VKSSTISGGGSGGIGEYLPLLFDESFLRFREKIRLKFSPISGENLSKISPTWEKIHLKFSEMERKFVENYLRS